MMRRAASTPFQHAGSAEPVARALAQLDRVILGKPAQVRLALACLLARGHLLIEDQPGVGKTTLAHALARTLGLSFRRVQFTSDLLPADLLGLSIWDAGSATFRHHPGPIFSEVLLADEINRAAPKTQSALLEAMEERQVSEGGVTRPLPNPFFVIATQNPTAFVGTSPLPEAQLDRFLLTVTLGYPDPRAERTLLETGGRGEAVRDLPAVLDAPALLAAQRAVDAVHAAPALLDYLQRLARATREHPALAAGLSPRALLGLLALGRAWAFLAGRAMVLPEDVQAVFPALAAHRLPPRDPSTRVADVTARILTETPIP
ncbi:ATPase associated with various cellular activities, AAA_3 [Deinococcus geothermalis DSM 11300]|uniref:ATPase associated with various cellular activities, AAA_3 n=1 Tax=Deinococcus geothermalis (strain DSM 11300 / CIP 105573 / AG-3a) TaxID=319795 RepID=Q1IXE7_DEIGD|nr:ATPase associated with various cellular activities, AAA_3 [Deinococcus geothermalis DSM 11300]MBI0446640.1 MoxR family ATPase [Deinococcus sp. DB0503]